MSLLFSYLILSALKFLRFQVNGQYFHLEPNATCILRSGELGVCTFIESCNSAKEMLLRRERPLICSFDKTYPLMPVVCCEEGKKMENENEKQGGVMKAVSEESSKDRPMVAPKPIFIRLNTTQEPFPDSFFSLSPNLTGNDPNVGRLVTSSPTPNAVASPTKPTNQSRALQKCDDYSSRAYVSPPRPSKLKEGESGIFVVGGVNSGPKEFPHVALLGYGDGNDTQWLCGGALISENFVLTAAHCLSSSDFAYVSPPRPSKLKEGEGGSFVAGGVNSRPKEFPHVALLGYGEGNDTQWLCGGALISENFVLTAAHCLTSSDLGPVKIVRLGDLDIRSDRDDAFPMQFGVAAAIPNPQYDSENSYHDVALLRLNETVAFNTYIKPACLHAEKPFPDAQLIATGWGKTFFGGDDASILQKVDLNETAFETCAKTYTTKVRGLSRGLIDDWQVCAEGSIKGGDTCQGDSGGPLQVKADEDDELHRIVGITALGINCGLVPGVYTRVSNYVPWIESVVWG